MEGFTNHLIGQNYSLLAGELQLGRQISRKGAKFSQRQQRALRLCENFAPLREIYLRSQLHSHIVKNNP